MSDAVKEKVKLSPKQAKIRLAEVNKEIEKVEAKLLETIEEDRSENAQGVIDKLFAEFKRGHQWIKRMNQLTEEDMYSYSPIGRRRFMPAVLTGDKSIISQQVRRGTNAPIQGFASEIGVKASRRILQTYYMEAGKLAKALKLPLSFKVKIFFNRIVHDATYLTVPYPMVIPLIHILQWEATYGITKAYKDEFNIQFLIEPEIEIETGLRDDTTTKWDWSIPSLVANIRQNLEDGKEENVDKVMRTIFEPWHNEKIRNYLQKKYPLLNVPDLDKQIKQAIKEIYK